MPRHEILRALAVPAKYRHPPKAATGPWQIIYPPDAGDWRDFARPCLTTGPRSLLISGTSGAGKSTRAAWLLSEFWRLGWRPEMSSERRTTVRPVWISAPALTAEAKSDDRERPLLRAATCQPLIVFDDALYARRDGYVDITLETFGILSARYDAGAVTIITTMRPVTAAKAAALGQSGESWEELGAAAYRRMADDGWFPRRLDVNWSARGECDGV